MKIVKWMLALSVLAVLSACGDKSTTGPTSPPSPVPVAKKNTPPVAKLVAWPFSGVAPLTVEFDASDSRDADGDTLKFVWYTNIQGHNHPAHLENGSMSMESYILKEVGTYIVTVNIDDGKGGLDSASVTIVTRAAPGSPLPKPPKPTSICEQFPLGGNAYNCSDFSGHAQAQEYHDKCDQSDRNQLDGDNDGLVCESS